MRALGESSERTSVTTLLGAQRNGGRRLSSTTISSMLLSPWSTWAPQTAEGWTWQARGKKELAVK